jgi:hypothetical protein
MQKAPVAVHHRSACSGVKALRNTSDARRQAAKLCCRFGPFTPSARSANLIPGDGTKNGLSRSEQKTVSTTQNNRLTGKAPYKFESISRQQRVSCELDFGRDAEGERYLSLLAVARAALHDRLGRRPCDVRTGQPVLRKFPRRPYRHEPVPLRSSTTNAPSAPPGRHTSRPRNCGVKLEGAVTSSIDPSKTCASRDWRMRSRNWHPMKSWSRILG